MLDGTAVSEINSPITYPMAMLSDLPPLPEDDEIARLAEAFSSTFRGHVFLKSLRWDWSAFASHPPYLHLAQACLASMSLSQVGAGEANFTIASDVFECGANLWAVMLEVDNRLARSLNAVLAVCLLAVCMLSN
jgi:hypothetical protein